MRETFVSYGLDATAVATALCACLARQGNSITRHGSAGEDATFEQVSKGIERADRVVLLVSPDWTAMCWPVLERHLARIERSSTGFLAKLKVVGLSAPSAVPAPLRPLLTSSLGIDLSQAFAFHDVDAIVTSLGPDAGAIPSTPIVEDPGPSVFVLGHPGSGKSTFCALLAARLAARGIECVRLDLYPLLQALFRFDALRGETRRFESDRLCEFVIKDASAVEDGILLMKSQLLSLTGKAAIVELAFSDGPALGEILSVRPKDPVVHIDAPLDACIRNNAARGTVLHQTFRSAGPSSLAFDRSSDVHYVPADYYERYRLDQRLWHEGGRHLSTLYAARYHRLENAGPDLAVYQGACRDFIEAIALPSLAASA